MKKNDLKQLQQATVTEAAKMLTDKKTELERALLDFSLGKFKNTALLRTLKKDIARINTIIHMKGAAK